MAVKHGFVSLVTDIGGPTYVQPTHWNAPHNSPWHVLWDMTPGFPPGASFGISSSASWGQISAEYPDGVMGGGAGLARTAIDFTYVDTILLAIGRASNANTGAVSGGSVAMALQYMASGFPGSWYSLNATGGSAPFVSMATGNNASQYLASTNGLMFAASVAVSAAVKALPQPVTVRLAGVGGNGSAIVLTQVTLLGL